MIKTYVDIGELGWTLYLYGYLARLTTADAQDVRVVTLPGREIFWQTLGVKYIYAPLTIASDYDLSRQDGFGIHGVPNSTLHHYFATKLPQGWQIAGEFTFSCNQHIRKNSTPVRLKVPKIGGQRGPQIRDKILIFPRRRRSEHHSFRNISLQFYAGLVAVLADRFPEYQIVSVGVPKGAYNISDIYRAHKDVRPNFTDLVTPGMTLSMVTILCDSAVAAIGGTSSLPKISLLQGVPTFIYGHERIRFTVEDNWQNTNVGFLDFGADGYEKANADLYVHAVDFVAKNLQKQEASK